MQKILITAALPYANGGLHIGHLAGAYLPADAYARYHRLRGNEVAFVCGSDEHGAAITIQAKKENTTPQVLVDRNHALLRDTFAALDVSFDVYHRTSAQEHHDLSSLLFRRLHDAGKLVEKTTEQYFDEAAQQFLADRYITGECPRCHQPGAYGDQCEKCGATLNPTDLINPVSTLSGNAPVLRETTHWFLPLQDYDPWLREWILDGKKGQWRPAVYGQCKSWLDAGLEPRAITRDLDWGVPVPVEGADGKVLYVWFDAPIGYISATQALTVGSGKHWSDYWCNPETKLVHFVGKDNIVFHCIIFPVILHALRDYADFVLPTDVPANEFLNLEGRKLSTSRNWAVWVAQYLVDFPDQQDALRYVLTAIAPETKDSEFTWADFQQRVNSELVAILGNYVNRVLTLTGKLCGGVVPPDKDSVASYDDVEICEALDRTPDAVAALIEGYHFRDALAEVMNLARAGNKYLTETEPWRLAKIPGKERNVQNIMNLSLKVCASLAYLLNPFLPTTSLKLASWVGVPLGLGWANAANPKLTPGTPVPGSGILFQKIEDEQVAAQVAKLGA